MNKKEKGEIAELRTELRDSIGELIRHMDALFEGLRSDIRIIAEQNRSIIAKLEEHDRRFDKIDLRFDRIDLEFSAMNRKGER